MISFTNSECVSNMSQKAFKVEFNKTFGGSDSNATFPSLLQYNAFSLQCKDIWASAPKSADARILLVFFLPRFLGEEKKKPKLTVTVTLLLKGLALFHAGDKQLLGFLQGRKLSATRKKNWIVEDQLHLLFVLSKVENLEYATFCESIILLPIPFCGPGSIRVNGTNENHLFRASAIFPLAGSSSVWKKMHSTSHSFKLY